VAGEAKRHPRRVLLDRRGRFCRCGM